MTATLTTDDPVLADFAESVGTDDPIAVAGGRTRWSTGGTLAEGTRIIEAPAGVVDYQPEEMTVRVRVGTSTAALDAELAAAGQRSALPERGGTVGGSLAVGENDLRALGRGMIRASLLQVRYVSAEGRIITSGGPTVKNVTGFDLPRLMVGSLGTLGLLAEVILRTNPIPAERRWMRADGADPAVVDANVLAPSAVLWNGETTWVELEGHGVDVDAAAARLASAAGFEPVDGPPSLPSHRWSVTPAEALAMTADRCGSFVAAVGLGLVFAEREQPRRTLDPAAAEVAGRLKANFDPTGRLNPGRNPAER